MPVLGNNLDFAKFEARNMRAHQLSAAPSSPVTGQLYYDTVGNVLYWWDGSGWQAAKAGAVGDATASTKGVVQLAGDLTGTAASPQIAAGVVTDAEIAAANKDGGAAVPSLRTLGNGAAQAAAGNDSRFTDSRTPLAHATTHQPGGGDPMAVDQAAATASLRTLGSGAAQAMPGNYRLDQVAAPTADVSLNSRKIVGLGVPSSGTDAANKQYVDDTTQGLDAKASVRVATTANIANLASGAPNTVDGTALAVNDRVLVKDQTTANQNGIYVVGTVGTGANGVWTRAADMDTWAEVPSSYVWVEVGTVNADTGWVATADAGGTIGTTSIAWVQFSAAGAAIAGAGLTKTGNTLDVVGTANRITVAADSVDIAATYVGQTSITTLGTVTGGTWNATTIAVANGGTGQTTAKTARETGLGGAGYYSSATHGAGTTITVTQATHGLRSSRGLLVQVQDEATGNVEIPDISVAANGDVTVSYGVSVTSNSKRVTVIG